MRNIIITPVLNGWVCKVGCSEVVFDSKGVMLQRLSDYIDNPLAVEKEFQTKALNKFTNQVPEPAMSEAGCSSAPTLAQRPIERINR